jgi:hypothetical protein
MNDIKMFKTEYMFSLVHGPLTKQWKTKQKLVNYVYKNYFPKLERKQVLGMVNDSLKGTDKPIVLEGSLKNMRDEVETKKDLDKLQKHLWNNRVRHFKSEDHIIEQFLKKNQHLNNRMSMENPQSVHEMVYAKIKKKFDEAGAEEAKHLMDIASKKNESKWSASIVKFYKNLVDRWDSISLVKPERQLSVAEYLKKPVKPTVKEPVKRAILHADELEKVKDELLKSHPELEFYDYQIGNAIHSMVEDNIDLENVIEDQRQMCDENTKELYVVKLFVKAVRDYLSEEQNKDESPN